MTTGTITDWLKSEGDEVSEGDPLLTVETEKAVNDVEAPSDGVLLKIVAESGAEIPVSGPMAIIAAPGESLSQEEIDRLLTTASVSDGAAGSADRATRAPRERSAATRDRSGRINASPAARKLAGELGVDLTTVEATGPGGRLTSDDVERAAASADTGPREERIALEDGRTIHALVVGPRSGHSMVFIHGLGGSQSTWQLQLAAFASEARLAAIDLPSHGQSDKAPVGEDDHNLSGLAAAVAESIRALGTGPATIVGHSLGGAVALELALSHAELVRSLVLVNSAGLGPDISQELTTLMGGEAGHDTARNLLDLFFEEKKYVADRGIAEMARFQLMDGGWSAQQSIAQSVFAGDRQQIDFTDRLPEVTQPVLLVWGAADRVIPLSHAFKAVYALPDSSLVVLAGAGHVPQVERADELVRAIRRFIAALDA